MIMQVRKLQCHMYKENEEVNQKRSYVTFEEAKISNIWIYRELV